MKQLLFALIAISLFSCQNETKVEEAVAKIPVKFKVERFDQIMMDIADEARTKPLSETLKFIIKKHKK